MTTCRERPLRPPAGVQARRDEADGRARQAKAVDLSETKPEHFSAADVLHLQRTAGNQAVQRLLGQNHSVARPRAPLPAGSPAVDRPSVQRFSITPAALDKAGDRKISAFFGVATSEYAKIRNLLAEYEAAQMSSEPGSEAGQERLLDLLEERCREWLGDDSDKAPTAAARRNMVQLLYDELPMERRALTRKLAQQEVSRDLPRANPTRVV